MTKTVWFSDGETTNQWCIRPELRLGQHLAISYDNIREHYKS